MKQIIFVTGNEMKVRHANEALSGTNFELVAQKLNIIEPRAEDPKDVVIEKALQAIKLVNKPLIVEDSGRQFDKRKTRCSSRHFAEGFGQRPSRSDPSHGV